MDTRKQERLEKLSIDKGRPLIEALQQMDRADRKLLMVTDSGDYFGILSAGDIQRGIIANFPLDTPIETVMGGRRIRVAHIGDDFESIKKMMLQFRTEFMPVLDQAERLVDVHFWDEVFGETEIAHQHLNAPVVIMAGGKGTRLKPFSNILPKALFPIGECTILEEIIGRFQRHGCNSFWLSVNYKADFIQSYIDKLDDRDFEVHYVLEPKPLGTAGSLSLLRDTLQETFFVSNCDILVNTDYGEIVDYHREHDNEVTLVGALKEIRIPYGTLEAHTGGQLTAFREKPNLNYLINTGLYLLEPSLLAEVPDDRMFHITELISQVQQRNGRVGVFPVSEKSWLDIGEWHEYERTVNLIGR